MAPKDENELQHMVYTGQPPGQARLHPLSQGAGTGRAAGQGFRRDAPRAGPKCCAAASDVLILAVGPLVYRALEAAEQLAAADGIEATVVNVRYIKPLDRELIFSLAAGIPSIVTVEDGTVRGGFASIIHAEFLASGDRAARIPRPGRRRGQPAPGFAGGTAGALRPECRRHLPPAARLRQGSVVPACPAAVGAVAPGRGKFLPQQVVKKRQVADQVAFP